jgi:hypothetical protein
MTDRERTEGRKGGARKGGPDQALLDLYDQLEDLYSILETLDELGIRTRDELLGAIDTLDAEVDALEAATDR